MTSLEHPPAHEAEFTERLIAVLRTAALRDHDARLMRRCAHAKGHACVRARLDVPTLDHDLRVGLFAQPARYEAVVRFSNQDRSVRNDGAVDIRGVAIKVLDVPGTRLLHEPKPSSAHDLVLISADRFVARDVREFHSLIRAFLGGKAALTWFLLTHWRSAWALRQTFRHTSSVLDLAYNSVTPYCFGEGHAVRYLLRPAHGAESARPASGTDRLAEELRARLSQREHRFDLLVQFRGDPADTPIEDPSVAWDQSRTRIEKVATLTLLQQLAGESVERAGEDLEFHPWRCLPEHRPLGAMPVT